MTFNILELRAQNYQLQQSC